MLNVSLKIRLNYFSFSIMISKERKVAAICRLYYVNSDLAFPEQPTHAEERISFLLSQKKENFHLSGIYLLYILYTTSTAAHRWSTFYNL